MKAGNAIYNWYVNSPVDYSSYKVKVILDKWFVRIIKLDKIYQERSRSRFLESIKCFISGLKEGNHVQAKVNDLTCPSLIWPNLAWGRILTNWDVVPNQLGQEPNQLGQEPNQLGQDPDQLGSGT